MAYAIGGAEGAGKKKSTFDWEAYQRQQQAENMMASQSASKPNTTTTPKDTGINKGTSGSGGGDSGGYAADSFDWGAYYSQLQAEAQAKANAAYERNMARIASAYGAASDSLKGNYDSTVSRLNAARDKSMGDVRSDAEDSLRQAYIRKRRNAQSKTQRQRLGTDAESL